MSDIREVYSPLSQANAEYLETPQTPSVESLIEDLKVELEASVHICDVLQDALNAAKDQKNEVLRKLTNLRMAAIAQEKGGLQ